MPTARLAWTRASAACAWGSPFTLGTSYRSGPFETTAATVPSIRTPSPAAGSVLMTTSAGTSSLYCSSATSSVSPTAVSAAEASWTDEPTTAGFSTVRPGPAARYQAPAAVPRTAITRSTMNRGALLRRYRSGCSPGRMVGCVRAAGVVRGAAGPPVVSGVAGRPAASWDAMPTSTTRVSCESTNGRGGGREVRTRRTSARKSKAFW